MSGGICPGGNCPGGNCPGGNCPDTVNICFRSRDMSFQSLGNLEEKCEEKIEHLFLFIYFIYLNCPFNKNCDVTSRTCLNSIFKSHVIQTSLVRIK